MSFLEYLHKAVAFLPLLAKFAACMMLLVIIPRLSRRVRLPEAVGLLLGGVLFGPHVLDIFPQQHPVLQFLAEVGMLLLMFFAGLELDLTLFRQKIYRSLGFGVVTTSVPLLLGALVTLWLGYDLLPAIVVGSLLASHTMLGSTIITRLGGGEVSNPWLSRPARRWFPTSCPCSYSPFAYRCMPAAFRYPGSPSR